MTKQEILDTLVAYEKRLKELGYKPVKADLARPVAGPASDRAGTLHRHALWMVSEMRILIEQGRLDKVNRWLGFMQGTLWSTGLYSIDNMREHNRSKEKARG
jgi:hypothetical protein